MGKLWIEVTLLSARGLRRFLPSIFKCQWYAVGWIDPKNKYCTKIDASGTANPMWKTKFATLLDDDSSPDSIELHVKVYRRDPLFLQEKLYGEATIVLKEFLTRSSEVEDLGTFQLRKRNSKEACGFIDISVRVSEDANPKLADGLAINDGNVIALSSESAVPTVRPIFPARRPVVKMDEVSFDSKVEEVPPATSSYVSNVQPSHVAISPGALAAGVLIFGDELLTHHGSSAQRSIPL